MAKLIHVQKPAADVSTTAEVHLNTINPTIVKEVEGIYSQFSTQERGPIVAAAMKARDDLLISDAAYTFIFNNAGIRRVIFS